MSANPLCPAASDALSHPVLRAKLKTDAVRQLDFFRNSLRADGGFDVLDLDGEALSDQPQELHTTTRLVHSYALGHLAGVGDCEAIVDAGIQALLTRHRDVENGGYAWAFSLDGTTNGDKLAYGHMFVLLAASSARAAGHPDADWLIDDVERVISRRFWDDEFGLMQDEFRRDWQQFSTYRGMNANMHGVEAHLAAFEVTGREIFLERAGRILAFFLGKMAPAHGWRIPLYRRMAGGSRLCRQPDVSPTRDHAGPFVRTWPPSASVLGPLWPPRHRRTAPRAPNDRNRAERRLVARWRLCLHAGFFGKDCCDRPLLVAADRGDRGCCHPAETGCNRGGCHLVQPPLGECF